MNFVERKNVNPTVKVRSTVRPVVFITELALNKMFLFTKEITTEVGWLGTAKRHENQFLIEDVFLLKQEVHATTTEITSEGLTAFAEELLAQPDGFELWNDIKMWGHSHVNMGITPSGQDNSQMEIFAESGHEFFIRLICNKKGELSVDVYDFENGIEYHNTKWEQLQQPATQREIDLISMKEELEKKYLELQKEFTSIKDEKLTSLEEGVKEEIKEKVKKFAPVTNYKNHQGYQGASVGSNYVMYGDLIDGKEVGVETLFTEKELYNLGVSVWTAYEMKRVLDEEYPELKVTHNDAYKIFSYTRKKGYKPNMKTKGYQ